MNVTCYCNFIDKVNTGEEGGEDNTKRWSLPFTCLTLPTTIKNLSRNEEDKKALQIGYTNRTSHFPYKIYQFFEDRCKNLKYKVFAFKFDIYKTSKVENQIPSDGVSLEEKEEESLEEILPESKQEEEEKDLPPLPSNSIVEEIKDKDAVLENQDIESLLNLHSEEEEGSNMDIEQDVIAVEQSIIDFESPGNQEDHPDIRYSEEEEEAEASYF